MRPRRIAARRPSVHGKALFALQPIAADERLIEYKGEVTNWRRAAARQRSDDGHTLVSGLSDGRVIDGSRDGNSARLLNHACGRSARPARSVMMCVADTQFRQALCVSPRRAGRLVLMSIRIHAAQPDIQ